MAVPKLGDRARDRVTGYTGIVVAETKWLNGCVRLSIQPEELDKDGKVRDSTTFDIEQLDIVAARAEPVKEQRGGPMPDPIR